MVQLQNSQSEWKSLSNYNKVIENWADKETRRRGESQVTDASKPVASGRWRSSTWKGSSPRGRKTLIPNLCCLAATSKQAMEVNPDKIVSGVPMAVGCQH